MFIRITDQPIDPLEALAAVRHPDCGAVACFEGNIRQQNEGREVFGLEYEVYPKLFEAEVKRIFSAAQKVWPVRDFSLIQRIGKLKVGESGVFLAVSSPHRKAALEACEYLVEEFKRRAPVWKKEFYQDSAEWVFCRHH